MGELVVPTVSVVVINYKGAADTIACLDGIARLNYPSDSVETIVIDNASGDGSVAKIAAAHPEVIVVPLETNTGFAGGCNAGASVATGRYVAFLNNDATPDPAWLDAAVEAFGDDPSLGCVASKVLDEAGETVDFIGASLSYYGHGFKTAVGQPAATIVDAPGPVLFASGAAMVMPRELFSAVGGFDERYFMFFEDVDLGWRLWLLGFSVAYVPSSLVFHRHHASMSQLPQWRETFLLERNALYTIFKNYDETNLGRVLPAALGLTVRRSMRPAASSASR